MVVAPGLGGSGPSHWQSLWERELAGAVRTAPGSWDEPEPDDWVEALDRAADRAAGGVLAAGEVGAHRVLVVAHSLGCHAAVLWAARAPERVAGLFCVAPPDRAGRARAGVVGFDHADAVRPGVPVLLVSSDDDPHTSPSSSASLATAWGAGAVALDGLGHVNADSGLGAWDQGRQLLVAFAAGL
ncbi:alpha/beta hydrolase [Pseudokineococcus sp. 5B2Z-1]|uniref:RBBP9/YdeN family alpha/beta hydrolase n=1 Tax=Pseudokineococcus sp. 5B2Z-1 TaxID=3132744 RepID=UPI0030A7DD2B